MSDELEALAQKGRAGKDQIQSSHQAQDRNEKSEADKKRERMLSRALGGGGWWAGGIFVFVAVVGGIVGLYIESIRETLGSTALTIGIFVALTVVGIALVASQTLESRHHRRGAMAWLRALPFAFPVDSYLDGLCEERMTTTVSLTLRFETPPGDAERSLVADAAAGAAEVARTRWEKQVLHIESAPLETYFLGNADRASRYSNKPVHAWFRALVDQGLLVIHNQYPLREVTCEMT